jgi:hypothetical protein
VTIAKRVARTPRATAAVEDDAAHAEVLNDWRVAKCAECLDPARVRSVRSEGESRFVFTCEVCHPTAALTATMSKADERDILRGLLAGGKDAEKALGQMSRLSAADRGCIVDRAKVVGDVRLELHRREWSARREATFGRTAWQLSRQLKRTLQLYMNEFDVPDRGEIDALLAALDRFNGATSVAAAVPYFDPTEEVRVMVAAGLVDEGVPRGDIDVAAGQKDRWFDGRVRDLKAGGSVCDFCLLEFKNRSMTQHEVFGLICLRCAALPWLS